MVFQFLSNECPFNWITWAATVKITWEMSVRALAQAADDVHRASTQAAAKIQKASEEAQLSMRKAAKKAAIMINEAIDEANEKIIRTTKKAIVDAVGEEEAEFFDLGPLKEKWVNREK